VALAGKVERQWLRRAWRWLDDTISRLSGRAAQRNRRQQRCNDQSHGVIIARSG
jgi:hypothetical protein